MSASRASFLVALFACTVTVSALLLFVVQPMFTKLVLPILGGSTAVWSTAMVFFQGMLLAGYAYAYALAKIRQPAVAVAIHVALLIAAGFTLPLSIASGWTPPNSFMGFWLIGLFTVSIGLPFFALSASNPLIQSWFVRTGHVDGKDPYFLYAASNIGSFVALLAYPVLLEPALTLRHQNLIWTIGFGLLAVLIAICGYFSMQAAASANVASSGAAGVGAGTPAAGDAAAAPAKAQIGRWIFLAAVPSGLLVAVTAHISTDVAAVPLLWAVPLSLYLLTWVLVFQREPLIPHAWMLEAHPFAIAGLVAAMAFGLTSNLPLTVGCHLLAFFIIAMTCHGELARQRPAADYLTTFYLSLSTGGLVGGLFAGLIAPFIFSWVAEYPILIVLATLCRPARMAMWDARYERPFWAVAFAALGAVAVAASNGWTPEVAAQLVLTIGLALIAAGSLFLANNPLKFAFAIFFVLYASHAFPFDEDRGETVRSFFGVHKIVDSGDGRFRLLMHGTTIHGVQRLTDDDGNPLTGRPEPIIYYHSGSGMTQVINAVHQRKGGPVTVGVVGLGTGSLACRMQPEDNLRYFEIDTTVVAIARDPKRFTSLRSCAPSVPIIVGDARLTLAREPDRSYDLIIVDAFSSDAIPIHLLTREAMAIYKSKLAPNGVVLMHVSNRHLELQSVVVGIAQANGLKAWVYDNSEEKTDDEDFILAGDYVVVSEGEDGVGEIATNKNWTLTAPSPSQTVWSDDYSNIIAALWRKYND